jgi:predicted Zn-dependent protease
MEGFTEAMALRPDDVVALSMMSQPLLFLGRAEEAGEYLERGLRLDASNVNLHLFHAHYRVSVGDLGGTEQALAHARAVVGDDAMLDATEALLWAKRGEPTRAEAMLARMRKHTRSVAHTHHVGTRRRLSTPSWASPAMRWSIFATQRRTGSPTNRFFAMTLTSRLFEMTRR